MSGVIKFEFKPTWIILIYTLSRSMGHICNCKQFLLGLFAELNLSKTLPRSCFSSSWIHHRTICWISKRFCQNWHWCRCSLDFRFFLHRNSFLIWIDSATKVSIVAFVAKYLGFFLLSFPQNERKGVFSY